MALSPDATSELDFEESCPLFALVGSIPDGTVVYRVSVVVPADVRPPIEDAKDIGVVVPDDVTGE